MYPFADWPLSRGVQAKHWLTPSQYTAHLRLLRCALDATNAIIPPAFPEAGNYLTAERLAGRLTNQAFDYCTFVSGSYSTYKKKKADRPLIQLNGGASALCLGAPTPRELAEGAVIELAEGPAFAADL